MIFAAGSLLLFLLFIGLLCLLSHLRRHWGAHPEVCRKISHVAMGMACLMFPAFVTETWQILCIAAWFIASLVLMRTSASPAIAALDIYRITRPRTWGEFHFVMGVALAFILADGNRFAYSTGILLLAFADTAAGATGRLMGKTRWWGNGKSLEGSVAFAATGILCMGIAALTASGHPGLWVCFLAWSAATMAEGLSTQGSDNLWIPLLCVAFLRLPDWLPTGFDVRLLALLPAVALTVPGVRVLIRGRRLEIRP